MASRETGGLVLALLAIAALYFATTDRGAAVWNVLLGRWTASSGQALDPRVRDAINMYGGPLPRGGR